MPKLEVWHAALWTTKFDLPFVSVFAMFSWQIWRFLRTAIPRLLVFAVIHAFSVSVFLLASRQLSSLDLLCLCFFLLPRRAGGGWGWDDNVHVNAASMQYFFCLLPCRGGEGMGVG